MRFEAPGRTAVSDEVCLPAAGVYQGQAIAGPPPGRRPPFDRGTGSRRMRSSAPGGGASHRTLRRTDRRRSASAMIGASRTRWDRTTSSTIHAADEPPMNGPDRFLALIREMGCLDAESLAAIPHHSPSLRRRARPPGRLSGLPRPRCRPRAVSSRRGHPPARVPRPASRRGSCERDARPGTRPRPKTRRE